MTPRMRTAVTVLTLLLTLVLGSMPPAEAALRLSTTPRAKEVSLAAPIVLEPAALSGVYQSGTTYSTYPWYATYLGGGHPVCVVMEFDLAGVAGAVPPTTLGFWIFAFGPAYLPWQIEIASYRGDGSVSGADFSAGTTRLTYASEDFYAALSLDVTALVQEAVDAGYGYIGFRLTVPSNRTLQVVDYQTPRLTVGGPTTFVPRLDRLSPTDNVPVGAPGFTLRLGGNNFAPGAIVHVDNIGWPTTFISPEHLNIDLPDSFLTVPGVADITVINPGPSGGASRSLRFTVRAGTATHYVDDDAPGDPGPGDPGIGDPLEDGSQQHPFDTVQEGLDVSFPDDTVLILPGLYVEDLVTRADGCVLVGSGKGLTTIRAATGPVLSAHTGRSPPYPLLLRIEGVTLEGDIVMLGAKAAVIQDMHLTGGSLFYGTYSDSTTSLNVISMTMDGGTIALTARPGGDPTVPQLAASIKGLVAPTTLIDFTLAEPSGVASLAIADSQVGGLDFQGRYLNGGRSSLNVSRVRFGSGGLRIQVSDDQGYRGVIEDSIFEGGDLRIEHPWDLDGGGVSDLIRTSVRGCLFNGTNLRFFADEPTFSMEAVQNWFHAGGIIAHWDRTYPTYVGVARVRAINNIFEGSPVAIDGLYTNPIDPNFGVPSGDNQYLIEALNNTIVGADIGIRFDAINMQPGVDTIIPILGNNIIAFGGDGISVSGFDPERVTAFNNDLFGNSGSDYVGLADRTGWHGNLSLNPLFGNVAAGDFHLTFGSPAIDAGRTLLGLVTTDFDGRPRPLRGRYEGNALTDIGAYEFALSSPDVDGSSGGSQSGGRSRSLSDAEEEERPLPEAARKGSGLEVMRRPVNPQARVSGPNSAPDRGAPSPIEITSAS